MIFIKYLISSFPLSPQAKYQLSEWLRLILWELSQSQSSIWSSFLAWKTALLACTKVPGLPEVHSSPVLCRRAAKIIRERWETQFTRSAETRGSTLYAKKGLASLFQGQTKRKAREHRMHLGLSTFELFQGSDYIYQWSWGLGDLRQWVL